MNRIDPDGLSDYFNSQGNFLGTDNTEDDYVRIISDEAWKEVQNTDNKGNSTVNVEKAMELSSAFSETEGISQNALLAVYDHYNMTDLPLVAAIETPGKAGLNILQNDKKGISRIGVKIEGNRETKIMDHANEIVNLFIHEKKHRDDYLKLGHNLYIELPSSIRENRAYETQMDHHTFLKTRQSFQKWIKLSAKKYGKID